MSEIKLHIESSLDLSEKIEAIDKLKKMLSQVYGNMWYEYTLFIEKGDKDLWRFDWQYLWNGTADSLEELLDLAIIEGNNLL